MFFLLLISLWLIFTYTWWYWELLLFKYQKKIITEYRMMMHGLNKSNYVIQKINGLDNIFCMIFKIYNFYGQFDFNKMKLVKWIVYVSNEFLRLIFFSLEIILKGNDWYAKLHINLVPNTFVFYKQTSTEFTFKIFLKCAFCSIKVFNEITPFHLGRIFGLHFNFSVSCILLFKINKTGKCLSIVIY